MKNLKIMLLFVVVLILSSCSSSVSPRMPVLTSTGYNVQVVKRYNTSKCTFIAHVKGEAHSNNSTGENIWNAAMNDLRNIASYKGADTIIMKNYTHSDANSSLKIIIHGDAYRCFGIKKHKNIRKYNVKRTDTFNQPPNQPRNKTLPPSSSDVNPDEVNPDEVHPPIPPSVPPANK